MKNKILNYNLT